MSSYEKSLLVQTKSACLNRYKATADKTEKMAMEYYLKELGSFQVTDDSQSFQKPYAGIGGYGDREFVKKIVARHPQTHAPILQNGALKLVNYRFDNPGVYFRAIELFKNPDGLDGVTKLDLSEEEKRQKFLQDMARLKMLGDDQYD